MPAISEPLKAKIRVAALKLLNISNRQAALGKAEDISHVGIKKGSQFKYGYEVDTVISKGLGLKITLLNKDKIVSVEMGASGYMEMLEGTPEEFLDTFAELDTYELSYTVTYYANGGEGIVPAPQETKFGVIAKLAKGNTLIPQTGFKLDHWNTACDDSGEKYTLEQEKVKLTEDIALYAIYKKTSP